MSNKKRILIALFIVFLLFGVLLYSPIGMNIRVNLAEIIIETRFQPYASLLVGTTQRDQMLQERIIRFCGHLPGEDHLCW